MINLLLPTDRQAIRAEYRHRLFVVGGWLAFGLTMISIIIISSFAFILSLHRDEVLGQIAVSRLNFASDELTAAHRTISEINSSIKTLAVIPAHESVAAVYRRLIAERGPGIQLTHFGFLAEGGGRVEISGRSETRAALLAYVDALRADSYFRSVESPVKNIIRERDISFNLIVTLTPAK